MVDEVVREEIEEITGFGERTTHLYRNTLFYAHLSLYYLVRPFIPKDARVLDVGCGTGYGSHYLARDRDLEVIGIDIDEKTIDFALHHFNKPNLIFKHGNLTEIKETGFNDFDFIYASNVLEHIENVGDFLASTSNLLNHDGSMFIVVPPITNEIERVDNIRNEHHLNIWSPAQWTYVLKNYFRNVKCYAHHIKPGITFGGFRDTPEETNVTEEDFILTKCDPKDLGYKMATLSSVFLVNGISIKKQNQHIKIDFIDDSFSRPLPIIRQPNGLTDVGEIWGQTALIQSFETDKVISQINIMFATYIRKNTKDFFLRLKESIDAEEDLVVKRINASNIEDNSFYRFAFDPPVKSKTNEYFIILESPESYPGDAVTCRASDDRAKKYGKLWFNGKLLEKNIVFEVYKEYRPI